MKYRPLLLTGLLAIVAIPSFALSTNATDEYIYSADFEGITVSATNPPDRLTGFIWAQEYLDCRTELHNGSNMLYWKSADRNNDFASLGGFGIGAKSNLSRCKYGESYQVNCYLEQFNMDFIEVEYCGGGNKWGAARLYPNGDVKNDNGGNDMTDVFYDGRHLSFKFTYSFNVDENVNGYITFKSYNSHGGYAYLDDVYIKRSETAIDGTFEEYPVGEFDATDAYNLKTILYTETSDMKSRSEIIKENNNQKLKISYDNPTGDTQAIFYFNKLNFLNIGREYTFTLDLATTNMTSLRFTYGGNWVENASSIDIDLTNNSTSIIGNVFSNASYNGSTMTMKFVVPNIKNDSYQIEVFGKGNVGTTPTITIDNTKMAISPIVESITLDVSEVKTSYAYGESFSYDGIKVYANFTDGKQTRIDPSLCEFTGYNPNQEGKQRINVSYANVSASYEIIVKRVPIRLEVDSSNVKKVYGYGEPLDLTNLVVKAVFADGGDVLTLSDNALAGGYSIFRGGFDSHVAKEYEITVIYKNLTSKFKVKVEFDPTYNFDVTYEGTGK